MFVTILCVLILVYVLLLAVQGDILGLAVLYFLITVGFWAAVIAAAITLATAIL